MYVITGVDGKLGGKVAAEMLRIVPGSQLIFTSPCPEKIPAQEKDEWSQRGVQLRKADYSDPHSLRAAFQGGQRLFMLSAMTVGEVRQQQHRNAIDAARAVGIDHITYTSFLCAGLPETFQVVAVDHRVTEQYLQQSGLRWNTLRDNLYLENYLVAFAAIAFQDGLWRTSAGEGTASFVARDDCARVAVALLTGKGEADTGYDVTGGELISVHQICDMVAARSGVALTYSSMSDEELFAWYDALGVPRKATGDFSRSPYPWCSEDIVSNEAGVREGTMRTISDTVERLTGRKPLTAQDLLESAATSWPPAEREPDR
ncbi:NAD(P)H-binding protein [Affinibrenneria salicis]|uniref:NAD(P)H-binding protein n=1 Tax=Affinibrenneria salicis TaxID=2590031 RepID=A0A5J5FT95_9GAMM|nr:NAD(P)H-binding protein [Affinibrenneria salicis]KAA8996678.1 NAD(P)H-binding protein [Affinibrenneria salicis]